MAVRIPTQLAMNRCIAKDCYLAVAWRIALTEFFRGLQHFKHIKADRMTTKLEGLDVSAEKNPEKMIGRKFGYCFVRLWPL